MNVKDNGIKLLTLLLIAVISFLIFLMRMYLRWVLVMVAASVTYGTLSCLISVRKLYFLSAASSHGALLAVVAAIPLSVTLGTIGEYYWAILIGLALTYGVGYMISKGGDPDVSTAVFVSMEASASVVAMYLVLTRYSVFTDLWAIILGDPLLTTWPDVYYILTIATITALTIILTFREQVCIGLERDCATLSRINVGFYDWITYTLLGIATIALIRVVGFVLEHVLLLLPATIANSVCKSSGETLMLSVSVSLIASLTGLYLALLIDQSPSGITGLILFFTYLITMLIRR
ncbi:MAG: ABC transporter [Thermofilum sp. ex4484_15]|nr:MAG: ABC transporter [Thermofilum sp. ex4484_15]